MNLDNDILKKVVEDSKTLNLPASAVILIATMTLDYYKEKQKELGRLEAKSRVEYP